MISEIKLALLIKEFGLYGSLNIPEVGQAPRKNKHPLGTVHTGRVHYFLDQANKKSPPIIYCDCSTGDVYLSYLAAH
jgi:hypothetical protein